MFERPRGGERAVLVGVGIGHPVDPHDTAEFSALAASAGTLAVGTVLAARARPDPKYFVGSGKAEEIRACAEQNGADVVLVDQTLTPSQERNLEKLTGRRVLDRNGLILDIFAQRARSFEGKLQVELCPALALARPAWPGAGPTSSGRRAVSDCEVPARPSWRRTAGSLPSASAP